MPTRSLRLAVFAAGACLLLAACSQAETGQPGATTADEDRQLNDAAAMLDSNSMDANALAPVNNQETR